MTGVLRAPAALDSWQEHAVRQGWSDGLPVIPPTKQRVHRALEYTELDRDFVVATLGPRDGQATVLKIAANMVMAGCAPQQLPLLIAAVEAIADPVFGLTSVQVTTNPATAVLLVNGPVRETAQMNAGENGLGGGEGGNAGIGRAIRLMMRNIGGGRGALDAATQGQPAKLSLAVAENEEASPWSPYHVDLGFDRAHSTVTAIPASGTQSMLETSTDPAQVVSALARSIKSPTGNDYMFAGEPWILLCPEHAELLAAAGYTKADVQAAIWDQSGIPVSEFSDSTVHYRLTKSWPQAYAQRDNKIAISRVPGDIRLAVVGGKGVHSTFLPTVGISRSVTVKVRARTPGA